MKKIISDNIEIRIYELLGVRQFQKLTFLLEKIIHKRDGGQNQNYHFSKRGGITKAELFIKYLFYNGTIHVRKFFYLTIYFIVKHIFWGFKVYDILFVLLGVKDLYCIMLQRYNYLRIKKYINYQKEIKERRITKKVAQLRKNIHEKYNSINSENDLEFVRKMLNAINNNEKLSIENSDIELLKRLDIILQLEEVEYG